MRLLPTCAFAAAIGGSLLAGPATAAPDNREGVALMSAFVASNGGLFGGTGVDSTKRTGTGKYEVTFVRSMAAQGDCTAIAGLRQQDPPGFVQTAVFTTVVRVETRTIKGILSDRAFSVFVFCSR